MTNKERVFAVLNHHQPDKIPFHIDFTNRAHTRMAAYLKDPDFRKKINNCLALTNCGAPDGWKAVGADLFEDEFGVRWDRSVDKDIGVVCNTKIRLETLDEYEFPDPSNPVRFEHLPKHIAANQNQFVIADLGFSLFERAWTLTGMENFLIAMASEPDFAHMLLDRILDFNLKIIAGACKYGIDGMMFGDDWGDQRGLIMGAVRWREFIKPKISRMYSAVKSAGKKVFIHSCGRVQEIFPDLIESGLDIFNPFQPEVMDVYEMKRLYGARLSFFGGISTQRTLPFGTPDQVRAEVGKLLEIAGKNGGLIAAPAHAIPADAKPENIEAMLSFLHNQ